MSVIPNYYKNRVCLNVLAHSVENAKACYEAAEGHVVLGVLSKNYASDEAAIEDMKRYQDATNNALSVGLGAGDPNQSQMVSRLSGVLQPQHVNQVFTGVGLLVLYWAKMIQSSMDWFHQQVRSAMSILLQVR